MSRCFAPAVLMVVILLALVVPMARAEQSPSIQELVQASLAEDLSLPRTTATSPLAPLALAGPIDPATYRLGPGDRLVVQWSGRVTRLESVDVGPAGDIFIFEVGGMNVAGQTLAAARAAILDRLQRVTRDVRVDVQLMRPRMFRVYLSGSVNEPGPVEAMGGSRTGDVLRQSLLLAGASRRNIRIQHRDGSVETADLERLFRLGDHSHDPWLLDGDAIVVPLSAEFVEILGAVHAPGSIELAAGDSASTLLRLAGGPLPAAAPDGVVWIHWTGAAAPETLQTSLHALSAGGSDGPLANKDQLFVRFVPDYRLTADVQVRGEVARPGSYPVRAGGTRMSEVMAAVGGLLPSADVSAIHVHRPRRSATAPDPDLAARIQAAQRELSVSEYEALQAQIANRGEDFDVDWTQLLAHPRSLDLLLRDNDVVTVDRLRSSIRIDGQVVRPGIVEFIPGMPLEKYVEQLGGFSARAWRGHEQVTHAGSTHTLLSHDVRALRPGDFIWVPTEPMDSVWRKTGSLLTALAQLATVVIAIRSLR